MRSLEVYSEEAENLGMIGTSTFVGKVFAHIHTISSGLSLPFSFLGFIIRLGRGGPIGIITGLGCTRTLTQQRYQPFLFTTV